MISSVIAKVKKFPPTIQIFADNTALFN